MEKVLLNNESEFKEWIDKNDCHYDRYLDNWVSNWKHYKKTKELCPEIYPCVLIATEIDGGNQAPDYWRIEFVYLSDFNKKE